MKYRYLTYKELDLLQEDFSEFLYQEGINQYEWNILQDQQSTEALFLLEKYSDLTFEKVMHDIHYLTFKSANKIMAFQCEPNKMIVLSLKSNGPVSMESIAQIGLQEDNGESLLSYKCGKEVRVYSEDRESDIFKLVEGGCFPSDESLFNSLSLIRKSFQN